MNALYDEINCLREELEKKDEGASRICHEGEQNFTLTK